MTYNYEQSIWGKGNAELAWSSPTSFRLKQALEALKTVPSGGAVLEVGCGAGQFIRSIKQLRPDLSCHGCDISTTALELAQKQSDGVQYTLSGEKLPYADSTMAAVLIFDVLEHVDDVEGMLREIYRVLQPNGVLYAFVPCEGDVTSWWRWLRSVGYGRDLTKKHAGHIQYFTRRSLQNYLWQAGFTKRTMRYSEHVVGQLLGVVAFTLMERAQRRAGGQINNEAYFTEMTGKGGIVAWIKKAVNTWVYWESTVLRWLPSPNVHAVVVKK